MGCVANCGYADKDNKDNFLFSTLQEDHRIDVVDKVENIKKAISKDTIITISSNISPNYNTDNLDKNDLLRTSLYLNREIESRNNEKSYKIIKDLTKIGNYVEFNNDNNLSYIYNSNKILLYEGSLTNNIPHDFGKYHALDDNFEYEGFFNKGLRHGKGKLISEGYIYDGDWENDLKHGQGEESIINFLSYKGSFRNGLKEGQGYLRLEDGKSYEGDFKKGQIHGKGKYVWNNDMSYIGEWSENEINGFGIFKTKAKIHKGNFKQSKKNGLGITFNQKNESVLIGNWKDDKHKEIFILLKRSKNNINFDELFINYSNEGKILNTNDSVKFKKSEEYAMYINFLNNIS